MDNNLLEGITSLARESQILVFGEIHGTQEVPALIKQILDVLRPYGFGVLGLELPLAEQDHLRKWALGECEQPPEFFTHPFGDGRGNIQVLDLIREAVNKEWLIVCFDNPGFMGGRWQDRDRTMADTLLHEWSQYPKKRVVCVCGNLHSRLSNADAPSMKFWPSFAANLQLLKPDAVINSINLVFHQGEFFNIRRRRIHGEPISEPYVSKDDRDGHSLTLHIPTATPVTHLARPLNTFSQFLRVGRNSVADFMNRLRPK